MTGILDSEVWEAGGQSLQPAEPEFWAANNLTTLWVGNHFILHPIRQIYSAGQTPENNGMTMNNGQMFAQDLANSAVGGRAGTVRWPGAEVGFGGGPNPLRWTFERH